MLNTNTDDGSQLPDKIPDPITPANAVLGLRVLITYSSLYGSTEGRSRVGLLGSWGRGGGGAGPPRWRRERQGLFGGVDGEGDGPESVVATCVKPRALITMMNERSLGNSVNRGSIRNP